MSLWEPALPRAWLPKRSPGHGLLTGNVRGSTVAWEVMQAFQFAIPFEALPLAAPASSGCVSARRPTVLL